jgi:hypothetical protein
LQHAKQAQQATGNPSLPFVYAMQVALRAPLSGTNSHATSKLPTPGSSRQASGALPPAPTAAAAAAATALMSTGPGITSSAPLPANVVAAATAVAKAAAGN